MFQPQHFVDNPEAMAKLYFRYGSVGSAKTLNLLAVAHNYKQQGKRALVLKPKIDTRFGIHNVKSRAGLEQDADVLVDQSIDLLKLDLTHVNCILVDEAQFLEAKHIEALRHIATFQDIPVICYGLRSDFRTKLFLGSQRLFELADSVEEVKNTCRYCNRKALFNMKLVDGVATLDGPTIQLGAEELYLPVCSRHYFEKTQNSVESPLSHIARTWL